jgi:hypothetical protein
MTDDTAIGCAVCGRTGLIAAAIGGWRRAVCPDCHHEHRIDVPSFDYGAFALGKTGISAERIRSQADFLVPHLGSAKSALEIGCAAGDLCRVLRTMHSFDVYEAIELSPARRLAQSMMNRVIALPLSEALAQEVIARAAYDVILSSHCLEHVLDLHAEMSAMRAAVASGGLAFVEVPNRSGNRRLPFDDNRAHLHFFSIASLTLLLEQHDLEVVAAQTGVWHDARYADCLRVVARVRDPSTAERPSALLSDHPALAHEANVVVWGAGKMAEEMLAHFFDLSKIAIFVDTDPRKHGSLCLGLPVCSPDVLRDRTDHVVLINSLEYEEPIRQHLREHFAAHLRRVIAISELLR